LRRLRFLGVSISVIAAILALAHSGAGAASGKIAADSGFRPKVNGFSFENYGAGKADLSANEVRLLFGSRACMFVKKSGACVLTPPGEAWLKQQNRQMNAGHCTGMSVLSLLLFRHQFPPFGSRTYKLRLRGNVRLQRAIAYAFAWQVLPSVIDETVGGTPDEIVEKLISALRKRGGETYGLVFYKPGYEGGHEVTPYAVEDRGRGRYDVRVYDNNWPGETRRLHINTRNKTWSYEFEPGDVYRGNAGTKTLFLSPTMPGLGVHQCPFCSGRVQGETHFNELRLEGNPSNHAHLLITDDQGRRIGYLGSRFVNEIPGASAVRPRTAMGGAREEPVYRIPAQLNLTVTIDGRGLRVADTEYLSMIGPGRDAAIDNLRVRPGDVSLFEVSGAVGRFAYRSAPGQTESPLFHIGLVGDGKGYRIGVKEFSLAAGSLITSQNDRTRGTLTFQDAGTQSGTFEVTLVHYAQGKVRKLQARQIQLAANQRAVIDYGSIRPGQTTIPITIS
jgi:hypothetical protein